MSAVIEKIWGEVIHAFAFAKQANSVELIMLKGFING